MTAWDAEIPAQSQPVSRMVSISAWALVLFASLLPEVLWSELTGTDSSWFAGLRIAGLAALILVASFWKALRPLRNFIVVLFVISAAPELIGRINLSLPILQDILGGGIATQLQASQFSKMAVALVMVAVLLILRYSRSQIYLTKGRLDAPITPVRWMGFPRPDPWWSFGGQYSVYIPLGMGTVLWLTSRVPLSSLERAATWLPAILVFAAMNAFSEEITYRASMLATLEGPAGYQQAWLMSAAFFGIAHFYGVPYGWTGMLLAGFNGWLLGKAMLETRGLFWAWWMHFLQDVVIFLFITAGAVTPGG